jgi:hypothetical protein
MPDNTGLKVFLSWSGDLAKQVAIDLRELLPVIFDGVTPWVSDRDIEAGGRGLHEISRMLDETAFGIIVTTRDNQDSQWLNFEAGALSKRFDTDNQTHVIPLLVDMESIAELTGPLTQFQAKLLNQQGVEDVLIAIGVSLGVSDDVVKRRLRNEWEEFEARIANRRENTSRPSQKPKRGVDSMVEETLELVRSLAVHLDSGPSQLNAPGRTRTVSNKGSIHAVVERFMKSRGVREWALESLTPRTARVLVKSPELVAEGGHHVDIYLELDEAMKQAGYPGTLDLTVNGQPVSPF